MGGSRCTFRKCNVTSTKFPKMSFFHYPMTNRDRFEKWIKYANFAFVRTLSYAQGRNRQVCGLHFKDECFMNYRKNRLTPGAVPTLDRLKNGQVLDYSLATNPKPTKLPPTTNGHLIPPAGVLVWGQSPKYWHSFPTNTFPQYTRNVPTAKKARDDKTTKTLSLRHNVSSEDIESLDTKKTDSLEEAKACFRSEVSDIDNIIKVEDNQLLDEDPSKNVEESVSKTTLEAICSSYEGEIAFLNHNIKSQEKKTQKEIDNLQASLKITEEKLKLSENTASDLTLKLAESEKRAKDLENKNQELMAKLAERLSTATTTKSCRIPSESPSLSKAKLFNRIRKYMGPSMTTLVRMEMFASLERAWKPDEKQVSVEILQLGEDIYKYFKDEWRLRLPSIKMTQQWKDEVTEKYIDDDDDV